MTPATIVHFARQLGVSWQAIGDAVALTAGEAEERYGEPEEHNERG